MKGEVVYLYAFDVANEILTAKVQEILSKKPFPFEVQTDCAFPKDTLRAFFERMSPESRQRRFFSVSLPSGELMASLCDSSDPHPALTLVVTRTHEG
jgi:hypothetical protein